MTLLDPHSTPLADGLNCLLVEHTAYLSLQKFYSEAWKKGVYPAITSDKVWMNARPHAASATAANDPLGVPRGYLLVSLLFSLAVFRGQKG